MGAGEAGNVLGVLGVVHSNDLGLIRRSEVETRNFVDHEHDGVRDLQVGDRVGVRHFFERDDTGASEELTINVHANPTQIHATCSPSCLKFLSSHPPGMTR